MAYALGLPAFVLIRSLLPGFYARQDTRTPVKIALVVVTVNVPETGADAAASR